MESCVTSVWQRYAPVSPNHVTPAHSKQRYVPPRKLTCQHGPGTLTVLQGSKVKTAETPIVEQALYDARKRSKLGEGRVGFLQDDKRPTIKTNRAGTRGFRAPEVLLKCPDQTVGESGLPIVRTDDCSYRRLVRRCRAPLHPHAQIPSLQLVRRYRSANGDRCALRSTCHGTLRPPSQYVQT